MKKKVLFLTIFLIAIFFRFNNVNWDSNFHLHPDERFLTMVGNASKVPSDIFNYLNPSRSPVNPNNIGYSFFVYGTLPLTLNKLLAVFVKLDTYKDFTLLGRFLSGIADLLIVVLVFKTAKLLEHAKKDSWMPYGAAFFYAIAVLPIQLSHFFAVDTFLSLFCFASFYFSLKFSIRSSSSAVALSALFFGLALACKVTAIFILPLNLFIMLISKRFQNNTHRFIRSDVWLTVLFYALISYFALRLADPYYFQSSNIFNIALSKNFLKNIADLKVLDNPAGWFPPSVQWIHKTPVFYSLINLAFFGLGLPYFALMVFGILRITNYELRIKKKNKNEVRYILYAVLFWVFAIFLYQSTRHSQPMRYFILLYPFFAVCAAYGLDGIMNYGLRIKNHVIRYTLHAALITVLLIWPVAFSSIYMRDHSRVAASKWIYQNIPTKKLILSEHWDDALPVNVQSSLYGRPGWVPKEYQIQELPVFNEDAPEKWQLMKDLLSRGDYYILSSNRGWGSMPTAPERYPLMTKFYKNLLSQTCPAYASANQALDKVEDEIGCKYKKIAEFDSYPQIQILNYKFQLPDGWADESFTVYDHPQVMIFKRI